MNAPCNAHKRVSQFAALFIARDTTVALNLRDASLRHLQCNVGARECLRLTRKRLILISPVLGCESNRGAACSMALNSRALSRMDPRVVALLEAMTPSTRARPSHLPQSSLSVEPRVLFPNFHVLTWCSLERKQIFLLGNNQCARSLVACLPLSDKSACAAQDLARAVRRPWVC